MTLTVTIFNMKTSVLSITTKETSDQKKQSKHLDRIPFAIWLLLMTGGFVYGVTTLLIQFVSNPIPMSYERNVVNSLKLPQLAICSVEPLNISKLLERNFSLANISAMYQHFSSDQYDVGYGRPPPEVKEFDIGNITWLDFVMENGPDCDQMVLSCKANYGLLNCSVIVKRVMHEKLGCCLVEAQFQHKGGPWAGFVIFISTPRAQHEIFTDVFAKNWLPIHRGISVDVADKYQPPKSIQTKDGVYVPANNEVRIGLSRKRVERINQRSRPCRPVIGETVQFSKLDCKYQLIGEVFKEFCKCALLGFEDHFKPNATPVCYPWQANSCWNRAFLFLPLAEQREKEECQSPCKEVFYDKTISYTGLIPKQIERMFPGPAGKRDFYKIHVYYDEMAEAHMQEFSILNFNSVTAGFGGLLGLYYGFSLLDVYKAVGLFFNRFLQGQEKFDLS